MTSKKQLRAEIDRLRLVNGHSWWAGFEAAEARAFDGPAWRPAHLARVADAAREEGRQGDPDDQPEADSTPVDEFADLAFPPLPRGLDSPTPGYHPCTCGFACRCATIPSAWVPGSVTR